MTTTTRPDRRATRKALAPWVALVASHDCYAAEVTIRDLRAQVAERDAEIAALQALPAPRPVPWWQVVVACAVTLWGAYWRSYDSGGGK